MNHSSAPDGSAGPSVLILPGIGNSGPEHWQSLWEQANPGFQRVQQRDWDHPERREWVEAIDLTVGGASANVILVAHSLACLAVAHWATQAAGATHRVKIALLVAVPDPDGPSFPREARGFSPVPLERFRFPSVLVAGSDDPYGSLEYARGCAEAWGARLVMVGAVGHINASSGLGVWPEGFALLRVLMDS